MKKLLFLTLVLSFSLAQVMRADNDKKRHKRQAEATTEDDRSQSTAPAGPAVRQPVRRPVQQQAQRKAAPTRESIARAPRSVAPAPRQPVRSEAQLESRNRSGTQPSNRVATQNRNINRNSFNVARSNVIRGSHDRNWWRSRYNTTFVLFGGGYYYWWDSYWYPAYGYSPYYNNYAYSEPIYGYNNLAPGQVIENVQLALRDQGYYPGAIDGLVGPQTRAALAAYQQDHGLIVTSAVDEPTLVTLGLA